MDCKKYNIQGQEVGSVEIEESFLDAECKAQSIKNYIVALRENKRQWSACTKTRTEVKHTTKKPFKQKGTGNARQGSLVSPQFRGGGIVFGPKPKFDQHVKINKKERRLVIKHLLAEKIKADKVIAVEDSVLTTDIHSPKTKEVVAFLKGLSLDKARRVLFIGAEEKDLIPLDFEGQIVGEIEYDLTAERYDVFRKSMMNIQSCNFALTSNLNGYMIMHASVLIFSEQALIQIQNKFA